MSDLPSLYEAWKLEDRLWAVIYLPQEKQETFARVPARDGQPDRDAENRARMLANVMNATRDMVAHDIRELLEAYEAHNDRKHHADWRGDET